MSLAENGGSSMVGRATVSYLETAALFAAYLLGYACLASWCSLHLPARPGSWLLLEAAALVLVVLLLRVSGERVFEMRDAGWRGRSAPAMPVASGSLCLLGAVALALRFVDPSYDEQEFSLRSIVSPAAFLELLAVLPFGAATEELIFRTCQKRLRGLLGGMPAVVAVALSFALYHRAPGAPLDRHAIEMLLATFAGGVVFAIAYERTGSIPLLIAVHLGYNLLAVTQTWMHVAHAAAGETGLFFLWLVVAGTLAWRARRSRVAGGGAEDATAPAPSAPAGRLIGWVAALSFGCGLPMLLARVRTVLGL